MYNVIFVVYANITDTCANYHDVTCSFVSLLSCIRVERLVLKSFCLPNTCHKKVSFEYQYLHAEYIIILTKIISHKMSVDATYNLIYL